MTTSADTRTLRRLTTIVVAALLCLPASAPAATSAPASETITGTVVQVNQRADTFVVAQADGTLVGVHAPVRPRAGWVVKIDGRKLANGTYAARHVLVQAQRRTELGRKWAAARRSSAHAAGRKWASQRRQLGRKWASVTDARRHRLGRKWAAVQRPGVKIQGTVTHIDRKSGSMTVSARGASVPVQLGSRGAATAAATAGAAVGEVV
ncbi:MAG: hypothetical protein QOK31_1411, partial [Solirubrobacteraceae bacterium]|nr:hypothetical protein [Solirubrobacteraceae bacterium]